MRRIYLLALFFTFILIPSTYSSSVAEEINDYYFVLKGGIYSPDNDDVKDFADEGINLEAAVGTYTSKYFGGEISVGFFQTRFKEEDVKVTTKFFPITFNLLGKYPVGPVDIYGGGGLGAYISRTETTLMGQSDSELHTFYGFQTVLGGRYNIFHNLFIGLEGKYIWTKTPELTLLGVTISDIHYDGFIATVNIGTRY